MTRFLIAFAALSPVLPALGPHTRAAAQTVPQADVTRITGAAPQRATARPKRPRRLLVFNLCRGFKHDSIPHGSKAIEIMGKKTGAYEAVPSEDVSMFEPNNIRRFDAIVMNNTTGTLFGDAGLRQSLLDFVRGGKGIVGVHAATDCFYDWREYGEMMGGYFDGHPWTEKVGVKLDDPGHPLLAAFGGQGFEVADEIYQFKDPYSRKVLRVLLSIDVDKTDMTKGAIKRQDEDFAVSWVRSYEKGRVFYCSLGHRKDIFWNPKILRHYLDGIQFALGDLEADTMPIGAPIGPGFRMLFNGKDLTGWKSRRRSWVVQEGMLVRRSSGDIWTEEQFGDFTLDLEFKIAPGARSGVFLRGGGDPKSSANTGLEIEIADSHRRRKPGRHDCGAIYDCLAPSKTAAKRPGEWNRMLITAAGAKIEVVLNGSQVVDADLDEWDRPRRNPDGSYNKYRAALKDLPRSGHIGLQSRSGRIGFRNIRIKGSGSGGGDSELRKVDKFVGEYAGTLAQGGRSVDARAQVVAQGDGNYKVVFVLEGQRPVRFELDGRADADKLAFSGSAEGARWTGELAAEKLVASSGTGRFELTCAPRRSPTLGKRPPPGAIVLLPLGEGPPSLDEWQNENWKTLDDGSMEVRGGDNRTRRQLGDIRLHLEFMTPYMPKARGQDRGNSGLYFQDRYEVQVLDSFGLVSKDNDCGGIYKVAPPRVNACRPPLTWQTYDVTFRAARLGPGGQVTKPVEVTVVHNGVTIHENQAVPSPTGGAAGQNAVAKAPLRLQDHGNPVRYRNIWVVELAGPGRGGRRMSTGRGR